MVLHTGNAGWRSNEVKNWNCPKHGHLPSTEIILYLEGSPFCLKCVKEFCAEQISPLEIAKGSDIVQTREWNHLCRMPRCSL